MVVQILHNLADRLAFRFLNDKSDSQLFFEMHIYSSPAAAY